MAAGHRVRQVGKQLQEDQKAVQRIVVECVGLREEFVDQRAFSFDVAINQFLGEIVFCPGSDRKTRSL
jgi:hypothetical protein